MVKAILILIIAYILGSINTSIIVGKIKSGEDIRKFGSGNAGATNTLRTFGKSAAILVVLGDVLKAVISIIIAKLIWNENLAVYISSIGVILGHNFPIFFGFKGGKGIVVSATASLFADWRVGLVIIIISLLIMLITKYVSLGSVIGACFIVVFGLIFRGIDIEFLVFSIIVGGLAIIMHKKNIVRLIKGTENKLSFSKGDK